MYRKCRECQTRLTTRNRVLRNGNICKRCHALYNHNYYWSHDTYRAKRLRQVRVIDQKKGSARDKNGLGSTETQMIYETIDPEKLQTALETEMKRLKLK